MVGGESIKWLCILMILHRVCSALGVCELSFMHDYKYIYNLTSPLDKYPHGVLSEDGFYKVAVNQTVLWFQLCDRMIFNHDPPRCVDCLNCGGPSSRGVECSGLVKNIIEDYPVCTSLGNILSTNISILVISVERGSWGWFSTFITIISCLFGIYLLAGTVYRYLFLEVHGLNALPNLDFWGSIPRRVQNCFASLVRQGRGPSEGHQSTYSRVSF